MATYTPPKRATAYTTYIALTSQANTNIWQTSVTIAAGDVKVSKDGGAEANITTLPTEIGTSGILSVPLSATEMTADTVTVRFHDAAGAEWCDALIVLHTSGVEIDDICGCVVNGLMGNSIISAALCCSSDLSIYRGDTWTQVITGMGDLSAVTDIWFGIKEDPSDTDNEALVLISETAGLERINGAAAGVPANGSITITDVAAGIITVELDEAETAKLVPDKRFWDVQKLDGGDVTTTHYGRCVVTADIVRATS